MTEPFGDLDFPGKRPEAEPIERGQWEPFTVYLVGDVVTDDEGRWVARCDYKSGALPPNVVYADFPDTVWSKT